jgi:predicted metal-dependent phosphoesterase TrpH
MNLKHTLVGVALGALVVLGGASSAAANPYRDCERRIERAEYKLDKAIAHHGYYSWQADHARRDLHEAREECRYR